MLCPIAGLQLELEEIDRDPNGQPSRILAQLSHMRQAGRRPAERIQLQFCALAAMQKWAQVQTTWVA